jgi:MFS family permease
MLNKKTKQNVKPAGLGAVPHEIAPEEDPRLVLADWMSSKDNPFFAKALSRKTLLLIGIAAYALRMALFAFAPELPFVLLGVALHGVCFGCFIFVAFMVVDENTTTDIRATAQNLFNLVIIGIGIIVGSLFATSVVGKYAAAGLPEGQLDYQKLFSVPMYIAVACFVLMLFFYPAKKKAA